MLTTLAAFAVITSSPVLQEPPRVLSMEEVARKVEPKATTPQQALNLLIEGNTRFFSGEAKRPERDANARRALILKQTPFATVLGCSDSRVPIEIVFDQGLGDMFIVRVAGNISEPGTLASVQYSTVHLKSKLVVVMGHEGCGAVAAAMLPDADRAKEPGAIQGLLNEIRPGVVHTPALRDRKAMMREAVMNNVRRQVAALRQDPTLAKSERQGDIRVVGAYYDIGSGGVDWLLTEEELRVSPGVGSQEHAGHQH